MVSGIAVTASDWKVSEISQWAQRAISSQHVRNLYLPIIDCKTEGGVPPSFSLGLFDRAEQAPAGAWVAITGEISSNSWYPDLLYVSLGVLVWIAAFDLGYAQMDIESDKQNGVNSFPARFQPPVTMAVMLLSTPIWAAAFSVVSIVGSIASLVMVLLVLSTSGSQFQNWWFRAHVSTGWILLIGMQLS